jgi:hypothetical protein
LFISWMHFIPSYIRNEIKTKTGIVVNEFGQKIKEQNEDNEIKLISNNHSNPNDYMLNMKNQDVMEKNKQIKKEYTPIKSYKPSGNFVYDDEVLNKIEDKFI